MTPTPITDAAELRCEQAVKLFMKMPAKQQAASLSELVADITRELLTECRNIERATPVTEVAYTRNEELATALERASMDASGPTDYTMRVDKLIPLVADSLRALPPTDERVIACLRACDGLATVDLAGNKRGWLAELCGDAVKLDEPYRAGAQKCLAIVKEMRASLVHTDGADYGILSRLEYRLQKVVDTPVAPSPTIVSPRGTHERIAVTEEDLQDAFGQSPPQGEGTR